MVSVWWVFIAFLGGFSVGVPVGVVSRTADKKELLQAFFAIIVLCVWVSSFVATLVIGEYRTPFEVHAALGMVGGWLFGQGLVRGLIRRGGDGDGKGI